MTERIPLGEVCDLIYGDGLKEERRRSGPVPVYGSNGIVGWHDEALTSGPTIIVGRKGSIGEVHFSKVPCFPIDTTYFIEKTKRPCDLRWLAHMLTELGLTQLNRASAVPGLNREDAYGRLLPFPPVAEQTRIAVLLDRADGLRRMRHYALELSDSFLPAAFLEKFGDPAKNSLCWKQVRGGEVFATDREGVKCGPFGSALKKADYVPSGIPVWTMENISEGEFSERGCLFVTEQKFVELAAYGTKSGDIIISRAGTVGKMAIVDTCYTRSMISTNLIRLSLDTSRVLPIYFITLMNSFGRLLGRLKRGQEDAYTFMSTGTLAELEFPLPPIEAQRGFACLVKQHNRMKNLNRESIRQADHLFQSLLHRAFQGTA